LPLTTLFNHRVTSLHRPSDRHQYHQPNDHHHHHHQHSILRSQTTATITSDSEAINQKFTNTYNDIVTAFNDCAEDDCITLNQCIARSRALLREPTIPRYFRIICYLQLSSMVGDHAKASEYHRATVRVTRSHEAKGQTTAEIDATLDELKASVEKMRKLLEEEEQEG